MLSPPPFQVEDQSDEDDEFTIEGSRPDCRDMAKDSSNPSIGDVGTSLDDPNEAGFDAENKDQHQILSQPSETSEKELMASRDQIVQPGNAAVNTMETEPQVSSKSGSGGLKKAKVKEVQWSAFSANLKQVDNGGFDFSTECANATVDKMKDDVDPSFCFVENPGENPMNYVNSSVVPDTKLYDLDGNNAESLENYYPGWNYDAGTGRWYKVDGYDASKSFQLGDYNAETMDSQESLGEMTKVASSSDIAYQQQHTRSVLGNIKEDSTLTCVSNWNLYSHGSAVYSPNMVFDPQYPGWYYDTNTQQWYTLESYNQPPLMTSSMVQKQVIQDTNSSTGLSEEKLRLHDGDVLSEQNSIQGQDDQGFGGSWNASASNCAQQNMWQLEQVGKRGQVEGSSENQVTSNLHGLSLHGGSYSHQQTVLGTFEPVTSHNISSNIVAKSHSFVPGEIIHHHDQSLLANLSSLYHGNQKSASYSQQPFQGADTFYSQFTPHEERSSSGRPAHALVSFGFGGRLVIMKDNSFFGENMDHGNQGTVGAAISILNLLEVVKDKSNASSVGCSSSSDYFHAMCGQSFPGPLVGGNAAIKDINKWIDDRIISCENPDMDFHRGKLLRLLLSLLKISFQHYGKLRSPFGSDLSIEEVDGPEMAVTELFASVKKNSTHFGEYGCMQNFPSDGNIQETAMKVENLLVCGRKKEALHCAQEGQLWGPALVLSAQLGDKFYVDTVKKMADCLFIPGSPLRTLSLLIAGQPADVFSLHSLTSSLSGGNAAPRQPSETQGISMLDDWEENLAIITANRTKDDELVIIHLGDCLWKEKGEVTAAHTCYLVAETNFEQYSDSARLCLVGADHLKFPRTYASPDAIQRTEIYEYSKVLGNSQFILLPFQPYKLVYAYMLAEVGKVSDSLRYCQASLKLLKNSGRTPEVQMWRSLLSSLEEQLRTHQQSGYSTNLAAAKLVGKLFTSIDSTIHRMIGAPQPSPPSMPQSSVNGTGMYSAGPKLASSHSTMSMSSLVPSTSVETISEWIGGSSRKTRHNRSVSEPDFSRSSQQNSGADAVRGKESILGGLRLGRIGSQFLQKTMGWVSRYHQQAKLGERNKFYYDEKLKRWVEEGAEPPAEETPLEPPPRVASFQNGVPDYNITNASKRENPNLKEGAAVKSSIPSSGKPPVPPSQNQFSARSRMGVRSRYVDTFNKGSGAVSNSFRSPAVASVKPPAGAKFFVPLTPATPDERKADIGEINQQATDHEELSTSVPSDLSLALPSSSSTSSMHRFPSMDEIASFGNEGSRAASCSENGPLSRTRTTSWSGMYTDVSNPQITQIKPTGDSHRMTSYITNCTSIAGSSSISSLQFNGVSHAADLGQVEL